MDTTIVNVAIPTLSTEFDSSRASMEWVVLGYLLSLAIWIPASGWIGDRIGTKKTFLFALATFTIASMLCGQAHSLSELILFRILQGVGGGMLTPVGTAMLFRVFPPAERARASTILFVPTVIAPALGPLVGGLLIDHASWRWIFYVNALIGLRRFLFGFFFPKRKQKEPSSQENPILRILTLRNRLCRNTVCTLSGPREGMGLFRCTHDRYWRDGIVGRVGVGRNTRRTPHACVAVVPRKNVPHVQFY